MSDVKDWLPLVNSAVVGLVAVLGIVITQVWTSRRERHAKTLEIEDRRIAERNDFQRKTLLQLQVALRRFARSVGAAHHYTKMEYKKTTNWGVLLPDEMDKASYDALSRVQLLSQRVLDEGLRGMIGQLVNLASGILLARSNDAAESASLDFAEMLSQANDRLGALLRKVL